MPWPLRTPNALALVANTRAAADSIYVTFEDIAGIIETSVASDPAYLILIANSWQQLQGPIQDMTSNSSTLAALLERNGDSVQQREIFLTVTILILAIGYFIANYFLVYRRTLSSMADLQAGVRFVGSGNLGYSIPTKYDDEISDLARSFNKMAANLKTITASKSDLEREITRRTEAEEELRATNQDLQENALKLEQEINERKKVEQALRESEAKALALVKYAPTGIYEIDLNGPKFISVNEAMCALTGYSREELFSMNPMSLLDEESQKKFAERIKRRVAGQQLETEVSYRFNKKDGKLIDIVLNVAFSKEKPCTALVIGHDISERKQAEALLQSTLERFYTMLGSMYAGVLLMTMDGKVEFVNQAFCDAYGLTMSPDALKGITTAELLAMARPAFKNPDQAEARIIEILANKQSVTGEQFELSNGQTAIRDFTPITVDGKFVGMIGTQTDITKLKRVEQALAASNQKNAEILDSITDDFYVLDRDWNFTYANKQFTDKIGKEPSDFVGNNIWTMFPKHIGTIFEDNFRATMEKQEIRRFDIQGKYTQAWYRMTAFPSVEGITVIGEDITEFKQAEDSLRESYAELERINRAAVGRELRMIELKKEINRYYVATGQPPRYMLNPEEDK
ncbi:PAS domain S-box protein [Dehalogenimonas etheniformans]|nr:PAS domain S-box protein [Dehalogenimonas etheniformans]QNT75710.1 PAS domain S-box protein [Dehalogenimonas etheniformans]